MRQPKCNPLRQANHSAPAHGMKQLPKTLATLVPSLLLAACVGTEPVDSSSSVANSSSSIQSSSVTQSSSSIANSSSSTVVSSSSLVTSSSPPMSSSSLASSSSAPVTTPDAERGARIYSGAEILGVNCTTCHSTDGQKPEALYALDPSKNTYRHKDSNQDQPLAQYISDWMPDDSGKCDSQCGVDVAAYIATWEDNNSGSSSSAPITPIACADDTTYGPRSLRILTRSEYTNTLRDLLNIDIETDLPSGSADLIPADSIVNSFPNNINTIIEANALKSYNALATGVANWAVENSLADVVGCDDLNSGECANRLVNQFGPRLLRRPISATEIELYLSLLDEEITGGSYKVGLGLILEAMLTSPTFLYRSELGQTLAEMTDANQEPQWEFASDPTLAEDDKFPEGGIELYQNITLGAWAGTYEFSGKDLLEVTLKATPNDNGDWPVFAINVLEGQEITVDHTWEKTYKLLIEGVDAAGTINISNKSVNGHNPGHRILVTEFKIAAAQEKQPLAPLDPVDSDGFILDQYEMASLLSFTFTGSTPDDALLAAAADETLHTDAQLVAQIERLLEKPSTREHFGDFAAQWLGTDAVLSAAKSEALYPTFTQDVRQAMAQEVRELFKHVVLDEGAPFESLYASDFTFANQALADFYGIAGASGDALQKVSNSGRGGMLTSGAFLTTYAHDTKTAPIIRAVKTRRRVLCHDVPEPPNGIALDEERKKSEEEFEQLLADHGGKLPSRTEYEFLTRADICQTCHKEVINPLGFGFEDFNAVGLKQAEDYNGFTIDATGTLFGVVDMDDGDSFDFDGAQDFANKVAGSDSIRECFIEQNFRLAMGTGPERFSREDHAIRLTDDEKQNYACEMERLTHAMATNGNSPRALLNALGTLKGLRYRKERNR